MNVRFAKRRRHEAAAEIDLFSARVKLWLDRGEFASIDTDIDQSGNAVDAGAAKNQVHDFSLLVSRLTEIRALECGVAANVVRRAGGNDVARLDYISAI